MGKIKFGTDGWRAVIADDFTFANVAKVAQAIADYYQTQLDKEKGLVVGYDARFLSREFAQEVAQVFAGNGLTVILSSQDLPTQCVSSATKDKGLAGGVMVTASHNPRIWKTHTQKLNQERCPRIFISTNHYIKKGGICHVSGH